MIWIGNMIEFIARKKLVMPLLSTTFIVFVLFHVLIKLKKQEFLHKFNRHIRVLIYLFLIYILFVLIIIGGIKNYILYPIDYIFYVQLCGAITLWCLFVFDIILRFSGLITALLGIPIGFFGVQAIFIFIYHLPNSIFYGTKFGIGHGPGEFFLVDLLLLMAYSLFIGVKNLLIKIRGSK